MGDNISQIGDFRGANVFNKPSIKDATLTIIQSDNYDLATRSTLESLLEQLDQTLSKSPPEHAEEADAVADTAKILVETATKEKPNKSTIKITVDGLLKAAENISKIIPAVMPIVKQVIALLVTW